MVGCSVIRRSPGSSGESLQHVCGRVHDHRHLVGASLGGPGVGELVVDRRPYRLLGERAAEGSSAGGPPRLVGDPAPGDPDVADGVVRRGRRAAATETSANAYDARSRTLTYVDRRAAGVGGSSTAVIRSPSDRVVSRSGGRRAAGAARRSGPPGARRPAEHDDHARRAAARATARSEGCTATQCVGWRRAWRCSGRSPPTRPQQLAGLALVARRRDVLEVDAAGALQQVAAGGGLVADLPEAPASSARVSSGQRERTSGCAARSLLRTFAPIRRPGRPSPRPASSGSRLTSTRSRGR